MLDVWMSHGDKVTTLPPGFQLIGSSTPSCPIAAMADESRRFYAVQFHPEVTHTKQGRRSSRVSSTRSAGAARTGTCTTTSTRRSRRVRAKVGGDEVILGLSGGVDSSVAAALIHRAIGDKLTCVFVDHGLLRLNEAVQVMDTFARNLGVRVIHVDASDEFLSALAGVDDPELKRKIIGTLFVDVFQREAAKLPRAKWLAQGTIYPDVIEIAPARRRRRRTRSSRTTTSAACPRRCTSRCSSRCASSSRTRCASSGLELGLPREMVFRHPFPGPGLGVRILGEVKREYADLLRRADAIFIDELRAARDASGTSWYDLTAQAFAVFLPIRSVGVMGDGRTYEHAVALRAVQTTDFMTAHWAHLPHDLLASVSQPHHQRGARDQPRGVRRLVEAAGDDRVGVNRPLPLTRRASTGPMVPGPGAAGNRRRRGGPIRGTCLPPSPPCTPACRARG